MVQFLLEHDACQEEDGNGNTPLHCAAIGGEPEVVKLLVASGGDLEATNHDGDQHHLHLNMKVTEPFTLLLAPVSLGSSGFF